MATKRLNTGVELLASHAAEQDTLTRTKKVLGYPLYSNFIYKLRTSSSSSFKNKFVKK